MRVLHYIDAVRLERGGVVRAVLDLTAGLAKAGAEVTLLTGDATDAPEAWHRPAEDVPRVLTIERQVNLRSLIFPPDAKPTSILGQLIAANDVVHLHIPWDPFLPTIATAARQASKPYLVSTHGMLDDWCMTEKPLKKRLYMDAVGRRLLRGAAALHFTASAEAEQSLKVVPGAKAFVAPLVLDATPYETLPGPELAREAFPLQFEESGLPRLLFLGRLQAIKGLPTLIEAIAGLDTPPHLLLAGPAEEGHDAELDAIAARHGLTDRVHRLGMVNGETKVSLYQAADAFVLPSHHENFGIALAEAMRCGTPVLTSKCVNIWPEVERHGGVVVEHSVEGFAEGLRTLLDELPQRKQRAEAERPAVFEWLDPAKLATQYLGEYKRAITSRDR